MDTNELLTGLKDVLFSSKRLLPYCFYGKYSRLGLDLSMDGNVQIHIAEANDPDRDMKKVEKGVEVYNNKDRANFTLSPDECFYIVKNYADILSGKYVNKDEKNEQYKNTFQLTHFPENGVSRLRLEPYKTGGLKITIFKPEKTEKNSLSYILVNDVIRGMPKYELQVFISFIKNAAENGPYNTQLFGTQCKIVREMFNNYLNKNTQNSNSNYSNNSNSKPQYKQTYNNNSNNTSRQNYSNNSSKQVVEDDDINDNYEEDISSIGSEEIPF